MHTCGEGGCLWWALRNFFVCDARVVGRPPLVLGRQKRRGGSVSFKEMAVAFSLTKAFFEWFSASDGVAALHKKHIEGDVALHMLKGTPMAAAPDSLKLDFARSGAGQAVAKASPPPVTPCSSAFLLLSL